MTLPIHPQAVHCPLSTHRDMPSNNVVVNLNLINFVAVSYSNRKKEVVQYFVKISAIWRDQYRR
jgi:hypothetical protein